nr:DNA-binding pseudobarrel domain-containing protein [Tanacetum cinerariifolium]
MASGQTPFFYHILMNPSSPHLPLPLKFVKKHLRNKILKKPILKSANGGYLWKLKMKKFDDHSFCFVDDKLELVVKRLAASTANLVSITSQTTTQLITETSSITTNIKTPNNTMDKLFTSSASSFTKIEIEITTAPINTDTPTVIMPPSTNRQLVTTPPPNNHGPKIHPQNTKNPWPSRSPSLIRLSARSKMASNHKLEFTFPLSSRTY